MCALVFQRLSHLEIDLSRARSERSQDLLVGYISIVRAVFVLEELSALWTKACHLRILRLSFVETETHFYHHFEAQLLKILRNLAQIRGRKSVSIAGPGPLSGDLAACVEKLMMLDSNTAAQEELSNFCGLFHAYIRSYE